VFFDDVELPDDALIGEEGAGWGQVTAELAYERSGPERIYSSMVLLDAWLAHLRASEPPDDAATAGGRLMAHLATLRSMSLAVTARLAAGDNPMTEAVLVKDLGTEFEQLVPSAIAAVLAAGTCRPSCSTLDYITQFAPPFPCAAARARCCGV
jgi:alkylation response protein AidB-like acyl-CoA dehydrogenase